MSSAAIRTAVCTALLLPSLAAQAGLILPYPSPYPAEPLAQSSAPVPPNIMLLLDTSPSMNVPLAGTPLNLGTRLSATNAVSQQLLGKQYPARVGLMAYDNSGLQDLQTLLNDILSSPIRTLLELPGALLNADKQSKRRNQGGRLYMEANQYHLVGDALTDVNKLLSSLPPIQLPCAGCEKPGSPMLEAYAELTRYYQGKPTMYDKPHEPMLQGVSSLLGGVVGGLLGRRDGSYDSPVVYRCQKNFALVVSAGAFDDGSNNAFPYPSDSPHAGLGVPPTLGQLAERAYQRDLIVGGADRDGVSFDAGDYPRQNLVTYTIGFTPNGDAQLKDAAQRGGGRYQGVSSASELHTAYHNAMRDMVGQGSIGVPPVAANPAAPSVFQASYQAGAWTGRLDVHPVDDEGRIDLTKPVPAKLPAPKDRRIVTTYKGLVDSLGNLVDAAGDDVRQLVGIDLGLGALLGELFGEPKGRAVDLPVRRQYQLGDIIDSRPEATTDGRLVAVGANDGMLHVFKRGNGDTDYTEVLGYIPSAVLWNTLYLARNDYGSFSNPHRYYVNGPLAIEQAGGATVLVGTLAQGGRGLFALKLDPLLGDAAWAPGDVVLWDKTEKSAGYGNLGHTFGRPVIAKVPTGPGRNDWTWAAIVANGYDSANGRASLYVIDLNSGAVLREMPVGDAGGNGLSAPAVMDVDGDEVADLVYAGDLAGDVWRFRLEGAPTGWRADRFWDGTPSQPIVDAPVLAKNGSGGHTVIFGTGRLLYAADKNAPFAVQSVYGLHDRSGGVLLDAAAAYSHAGRDSRLTAQTIVREEEVQAGTQRRKVRLLSRKPLEAGKGGWFLDLPSVNGERVLHSPQLIAGRLYFSTQMPIASNGQRCAPPGDGWIMALDPANGGRIEGSTLDVDGDGHLTDADRVRYSGDAGSTTVSGVNSRVGMPSALSYLGSRAKSVTWQPYRTQDGQINNRANLYSLLDPARLDVRLTMGGSRDDKAIDTLKPLLPGGMGMVGYRLAWREIF
ncbi:pilus assembly protein [Crenobacter luteus]|uniref:PilY1 beta-propeller domain-containing protein n=1 Tax=Crenobacter luteus TaxID=1452487 RepID=A0A161SI37_9NEIS|nr:PilC/PilY family type IV pilus protein [Crenobacter luteus]KZE33500.1 hypothetical protein AVW16_08145 [Crenobacter luteus]